jgi:hypothetical protein
MTIKKNTFSTLVLKLFFPSIANCRKLKIQKNPKIDFPYCAFIDDVLDMERIFLDRGKTNFIIFLSAKSKQSLFKYRARKEYKIL